MKVSAIVKSHAMATLYHALRYLTDTYPHARMDVYSRTPERQACEIIGVPGMPWVAGRCYCAPPAEEER